MGIYFRRKHLLGAIVSSLAICILALSCSSDDSIPDVDIDLNTDNCTFFNESVVEADIDFSTLTISPSSTDLNIDLVPEKNHIAQWRENVELRPELFLWLGGTNTRPEFYSTIQSMAAFAGYRTINLAYYNVNPVHDLCLGKGLDCAGNLRSERLYGADTHQNENVNEANSIVNRLQKLLVYLHGQYPSGGWDAYYGDTGLIWSKIIVAGHSQGGGFALYISKDHLVARAITFSNVGDFEEENGQFVDFATWTKEDRVTGPERVYGIYHADEGTAQIFPDKFKEYGVDQFGPPQIIEQNEAPFGCTQTLVTTLRNPEEESAHRTVANDGAIPMADNGFPVNIEAYLYLMTAERE